MKKYSDEEILVNIRSQSKRDNDRALSMVYETHYGLIANFVKNNNGSENDAADIFQDAIIVFYSQMKKSDFDLNCAISTYLFSVSRNLWLKKLRGIRKASTLPLNEEVKSISIEENHLSVLIESEEKTLIAEMLGSIGEECRKVILYYYYERFRMKKIAQLMGLSSEQAAKNKKSRCMKRLVELVEDNENLKQLLKK